MNYSNLKVAVIGDVMLDVWEEATEYELSQEAPVLKLKNPIKKYVLGGAGNVAMNIKSLGAKCWLYGMASRDRNCNLILAHVATAKIGSSIVEDKEWVTTVKHRIIANGQQICRLDYEFDGYKESVLELQHDFKYDLLTKGFDAIVVADYNKGVMQKEIIDLIKKTGIPFFVDPKKKNFFEYGGATIFKPNRREWEDSIGSGDSQFQEGIENIVITFGNINMELSYCYGERVLIIPAHKVEVSDVTGAGDTVMASMTLEYLRTGDIVRSAKVANVAGALAVQKHCTAQITVDELKEGVAEWL